MKIYKYESDTGNIGDDFNEWLWPKLIPNQLNDNSSDIFVGIGSVFDDRFEKKCKKNIFGSGARSVSTIPSIDSSWHIYFTRGPLTANAIGFKTNHFITDPGILASIYFKKENDNKHIGLIPYYRGNHAFWKKTAESLNLKLISPHLPVEKFFAELSSCKSVITESMHGAIFADALRIPWASFTSYSRYLEGETNEFKWTDWLHSMNLKIQRHSLPIIWPEENTSLLGKTKLHIKNKLIKLKIQQIASDSMYNLSDQDIFEQKISKILEMVEVFKSDHKK